MHNITNVPFVDLERVHAPIRKAIDKAIQRTVYSGKYINGGEVRAFEKEFSEYVGSKHTIGTSSGTIALEIALRASGIGNGHDVIVPANSFIATAEAVSNVGATPVFADCKDDYTIDPNSISNVMTKNVRAIIPVHLYGRACDMKAIRNIARSNELYIIQDCAQSHGLLLKDDDSICCYSFYPGKNLGAMGDSGAITTNHANIGEKCRMLMNHGRIDKYDHKIIGTNARMDEIQAAVLRIKLPRLNFWNANRRRAASVYMSLLSDIVIIPDSVSADNVYHLLVIRIRNRDKLIQYLKSNNIGTGIHYPCTIPESGAYRATATGEWDNAIKFSRQIVSLPMHGEITEEEVSHVCNVIREAVQCDSQ